MRLLLISLFTFISIGFIIGQEVDQISVGTGYSSQTFYEIETGESTTIDGNSWDISFSVFGQQDAGVFVNEAAASMDVALELYSIGDIDFETAVSESDLLDRLYNDEKSWSNGAFNEGRDVSNFADYGWGEYNPMTNSVSGIKVFAIKLRNGKFVKIQIESLIGPSYTFRYADLDGGNEKSVTFSKTEFIGKQMAYFSFEGEEMLDLEPLKWDLLYARYSSRVPDVNGDIFDYVVTGILGANGVEVAQADAVDPATVLIYDYANDFSRDNDVIGHDWKDIDIATLQWSLVYDRVYFVKTAENKTYQLYFIDFEGSSSGVATFEKTEIIGTSNTDLEFPSFTLGQVYPNPSSGSFQFEMNTLNATSINLSIYQLDGKRVYQEASFIQAGNNTLGITDFIGSGNYVLVLNTGDKVLSQIITLK